MASGNIGKKHRVCTVLFSVERYKILFRKYPFSSFWANPINDDMPPHICSFCLPAGGPIVSAPAPPQRASLQRAAGSFSFDIPGGFSRQNHFNFVIV